MAQLHDILAYVCAAYPHKNELSRARITKIVYLADWKSAIDRGRQLSEISWYFDNYGPFVWDVWKTAESMPQLFNIEHTANMYGGAKHVVRLVASGYQPTLTAEEKAVLDHVVEATKGLNWNDFIRLVYSTHPVISSERYTPLNLIEKADEYRQEAFQS
jgi:hypothetical protein